MARQVRAILLAQFLSSAGTWAQNFAVAWLVYRVTDSAFLLGVVACLNQLPALLIGRFAGRCVDLHLSKNFLLAIQVALIGQCLLLIATIQFHFSVIALVVLCVLQGTLFAFEVPALQTFIAGMVVDNESKGRIATWNSLSVNAGRLVGPALAGYLMPRFGEIYCFAFNAASYLPLIAFLVRFKGPARLGRAHTAHAGAATDAHLVSRHIAVNGALREPLIAAAAMFALTMPFLSFIPAITILQLKGEAGVYGTMAVATGVGAAAASVWAARLTQFSRVPQLVPAAIIASGLVLAAVTVSKNAYLTGLLFFLIGFCLNISGTLINAWLHLNAPEQWRGSVISRYNMASALYPIGSMAVGAASLMFPVVRVLMVMGCVCAMFVLIRRYFVSNGKWSDPRVHAK
ncbi:MFS transporter [Aquabacterium sp. A7-Y]|uniref:MFS transporter n=1 Tax=Aquabacterium sp. A7-Y TaxID=1349605 RepID=UPI00223DAE9C|nr:MFS transporter [Aquabacterium sp. A7-Y]MCW7536781.1 MFS transporter [Aquabacterium sp. A7-Y]